jgi:small subunit ribosomal protein S20
MANIKSAEKQHRQSLKRRARNKASKTRVRAAIKAHRAGDAKQKASGLPDAYSQIDVARRKGVLHRNAAARYKSRLARASRAAAKK